MVNSEAEKGGPWLTVRLKREGVVAGEAEKGGLWLLLMLKKVGLWLVAADVEQRVAAASRQHSCPYQHTSVW